jgi:hypothetical protein
MTTITTSPIPRHPRFIELLAQITNTSEEAISIMPASYLPIHLYQFFATATVSEIVAARPLLLELDALVKSDP